MSAATGLRVLPAMVLTFPIGLPGLAGARRFRLEPLGEPGSANPFGRLVALDPVPLGGATGPICLTVATTGLLWPDLSVEIDDNAEAVLGLEDAGEAVLLAVVTLREPAVHSTVNLFAPIVVNVPRAMALQFVPKSTEATVGRLIQSPLPLPLSPP